MKNSPRTELIILAAGRGTRLGELGNQIPKALIKTCSQYDPDETMISRIIRQFAFVASRINVVVGHRRDLMEAYLKHHSPWVNIIYNAQYESGTNLTSLKMGMLGLSYPCDNLLIIDADTYLANDSKLVIQGSLIDDSKGIIFTTQSKRPDGEWAISTDDKGFITSISTKATSTDKITSGLTLFKGSALEHLMDEVRNSEDYGYEYWDDIYLKDFKEMGLKSINLPGFVGEIDTIEDIDIIRREASHDIR